MANDPQVPWSDEQWARTIQVVQEEAKRARVAATFLPLYGPLDPDTDFVRKQDILYGDSGTTRGAATDEATKALQDYSNAMAGSNPKYAAALAAQERYAKAQAILGHKRLGIDDRDTIRLATLQVIVPVRNAQMADPELTSVLALFRRAANVIARTRRRYRLQGARAEPNNHGRFCSAGRRGRSARNMANHGRAKGGRTLVAHISTRVVSSVPQARRAKRPRNRTGRLRRHWRA